MIIRLLLSREGLTSSRFHLVCTSWVERLGWLSYWLVVYLPCVDVYPDPWKHPYSVRLSLYLGAVVLCCLEPCNHEALFTEVSSVFMVLSSLLCCVDCVEPNLLGR